MMLILFIKLGFYKQFSIRRENISNILFIFDMFEGLILAKNGNEMHEFVDSLFIYSQSVHNL